MASDPDPTIAPDRRPSPLVVVFNREPFQYIINHYDVERFAQALELAIDMPTNERRRRMQFLRRTVAGRNIFSWASDILKGLENLDSKALPPAPGKATRGRKTALVRPIHRNS